MEFTRVKKRGQAQKTHKTWISECRNYLIRWRNQVGGIRVTPAYHALVRTQVQGRTMWAFAGRRGPYRKLKTAIDACVQNRRVWEKAITIAEGPRSGRNDSLRSLRNRSRVGSGVSANRFLNVRPVWVKHAVIKKVLFPNE